MPQARPLTQWVRAVRSRAQEAFDVAAYDANVGRFVLFGVIVFYLFLIVLADLACRNRIGRTIKQAEAAGVGWEASR
ncbi:MAG: hypothetical protein IID40_05850 [Planctomycetes bacterium]|nr:hypothetical protein [Planctomycetota bacterium]